MATAPICLDDALAAWVSDARRRTIALLAGLTDDQLQVPCLEIVNPPLWEAGHVAWFQEKWVLRQQLGRRPLRADVDALYDSAAIPHERRWSLALPGRGETIAYLSDVCDRVLEALVRRPDDRELAWHAVYSVFHEDMHAEAFALARQALADPPPAREGSSPPAPDGAGAGAGSLARATGEVALAGARFPLGAGTDQAFVFDNEKWAYEVEMAPFEIARTAVTQAQFAEFVDAGGYGRPEFWSEAGWKWRVRAGAEHPVYWRRGGTDGWERRHFDRWQPLEPQHPVVHVNWFEAEAWCRWSGRRLPTEAEWERAASATVACDQSACGPATAARRYPWGDDPPTPERANLDGDLGGTLDVRALPAGDSAAGCRQMIGNVWEWTASDFGPYPGFVADPYQEYSRPWFGTHKVLRGGAWATRSRLIRNTYRNFYTPDRRDVLAGFRTCAVQGSEAVNKGIV